MKDNYNCEGCQGYKVFTCDRYEMLDRNNPLCLYKDALNKLEIKKSELEELANEELPGSM